MVYSIANRISKPQNCIIGFGIPTSEKGYTGRRNDIDGRFAKKFDLLSEYRNQVIQPYEQISARIKDMGTRVIPDLTLSKFGDIFAKLEVHAVILFSHWQGDAIEFKDGFANINSIIEHVPIEYAGILDLCVCHPNSLISELRQARPHCIIKWIDLKATPIFWLYFYQALFQYLNRGKKSYLQGFEDLIVAQIKQT